MGSVAERPLQTLFTGQEFNRLRTDLGGSRKTSATSHCDNCYTIKKLTAAQRTFDSAYALGDDTAAALVELDHSHPEFAKNYRLIRSAYLAGEPLPPTAQPLRMEIQIGEHCDIRCIMCWQDHARPRMLKPENFEQIKDIIPFAASVLFTGGEPTVFKDFWRLVDTFKEVANPYARLQLLTHGQHLKDNLRRFDGINNVSFMINVDGPTKEVYEKIRFGSSWEKMTASLQAVADAKRTRPGWYMNTTFLLMRSNIDLIEEAINFADTYEASFGCGMIAGEYTPVAQCRTYFEENIFRFDHLGYSKDEIISRLEQALPRADRHPYPLARSNIEATIEQVRLTHQLHVPSGRVSEMRAMRDDQQLSRAILEIVLDGAKQSRPTMEQLRNDVANAEQLTGSHSEMSALATITLALRLIEDGVLAEAEMLLERAIVALRNLNDSNDHDLARAHFHYGRSLALQSKEGAAEQLEKSLEVFGYLLGRNNTQTAEAALELGKFLNHIGKHSDAVIALEHAYDVYKRTYGKQENSSYVAVSASELGKAYLGLGRWIEAEAPLKRSMQMYEKLWGMDHSITGVSAHQLSQAYVGAGRYVEAIALMNRYLSHYEEKFGTDHLLTQLTNGYLVQAQVASQSVALHNAP